MNYNRPSKRDTKDNTEGNDVCYKKYKKKRISNYYKVQDFE